MARASVTQTRTFVFDPASLRLTSSTSPETGPAGGNGTTSYTYNADGTPATRTDPKGQRTSYSYDAYQRVTKVTHGSDTSQTVTYYYDADPLDTGNSFATNPWGRVTAVEIGACGAGPAYAEEYAYNAAGQATAKRVSIYKTVGSNCGAVTMTGSFAYDSEGKLTAVTYPAGTAVSQLAALTVNYTYDSMSRLTGASDNEHAATLFGCSPAPPAWNGGVAWASGGTYNAAGQLIGLTELGNMTATCTGTSEGYFNQAWQYNSLNQLSEIDTSAQANGYPAPSASPGLAAYFFARYHFSPTANNGQISQTDDARLGYSIGYSYDSLKRLTATTGTQAQTFGYDGFGNLTAKSVPAGSAEPAFPGVNSLKNQLTGVSYDLNGNTTALNGYGLTYDMENRLISVTNAGTTETYQYDASNHRVERISPQGYDTVYFYGPNGKVLAEFQLTLVGGSGYVSNLSFDSVYFGGMLLGTTQLYAGTEYSSILDRLGTGHPGYAYGTDIGTKTGSPLVDFATYLNDSTTGFEYANQRWYSAGMGRFLTVDPSGKNVHILNPLSWNRYSYGSGDPVGNNDPMGLFIVNPNGPLGGGGGDDDDDDPSDLTPFMNSFFPHILSAYQRAFNRLSAAQDSLVNRNNFSVKCQNDIAAIAAAAPSYIDKATITLGAIQDAASVTNFENGIGSSDPASVLFQGAATQAGQSLGDVTVGSLFNSTTSIVTAETTMFGNTVYINPAQITGSSSANGGLLMHEMLHELGLNDSDIGSGLQSIDPSIQPNAQGNWTNSKQFSQKFAKDCFSGKGNN
jgi:RHS repeat-associated protein